MGKQDHDVMEHILSLLQVLQQEGISMEQSAGPEARKLIPDDISLLTAYEMLRFMEEIPGGFMLYRADEDEQIVYANKGLLHILRCEDWAQFRALTGCSFRGLVHPEDLDEVEESIRQQIASSQYDLDYVEYRAVRWDGTVAWIEDYGHFVRGEAVGDFFYVFLGDATEKRDRLRSSWEQEERRYQGIIQKYSQEMTTISQEHLRRLEVINGLSVNYESILYAELDQNRIMAYRLSQRTARQLGEKYRMKKLDWYVRDYVEAWVHPEDRERVARETDPQYMRETLSKTATYYINYRVICQGEVQYLQLRIVNVGGGERGCQAVLGYRRMDEELQRELQQKQVLAEALTKANLAIEAKNEFLSNMSHDMRTPLNAIFGFTALAKRHLQDPEAVQKHLNQVEDAGRQLLDLIDKVLKVTWIGAQEQWEEEECDLCRTLRKVCVPLEAKAETKGLSFALDCAGVAHSRVRGDRGKLMQLFTCLAGNAVAYTQQGGRVAVTLSEEESRVSGQRRYRFVVEDTGVGIGEDFLEQIFEPFTREKNTTLSGVSGTGLGLTIARHIAERMGGSIQVDSTVGEGSVFTAVFHLPGWNEEPASPAAAGEGLSGMRVLLVEDNAINLEIETVLLQEEGFLVDTAENGKAAVEKLERSAPGDYGLVLMDIQMPVMDGWQAAQAIRGLENPALAGIPIIALSANSFESDVRRSLESGMDAHLPKPVDIPQLLEEIRRVLRRGKCQEEFRQVKDSTLQ